MVADAQLPFCYVRLSGCVGESGGVQNAHGKVGEVRLISLCFYGEFQLTKN